MANAERSGHEKRGLDLATTTSTAGASAARPLPWLGWHYSLILPGALIALVATLAFAGLNDSADSIAFRVLDEAGQPVVGANVTIGATTAVTDEGGIVDVATDVGEQGVIVESPGFITITATLDPEAGARQSVSMSRTSSESVPAADQRIGGDLGATPPPDRASPPASPPPVRMADPPVASPEPSTPEVAGVVTNTAGEPLGGVRISDGASLVVTGKDGVFSFEPGDIEPDAELRFSASGYGDALATIGEEDLRLDVVLDLQPIKALYLNPNITETGADIDRLIEIINTTEANAIVIDIKEELVFYDSNVEFFRENGTVVPKYDATEMLAKFQEHGIYTIARHVVFKDSLVAEKNPDLAVINSQTGELWRDMNGVAWVNPMVHTLWDVNAELAVEAANLGFDEIQFDYVRFPTDGDLTTTDFGIENTQENRERAIQKFLDQARTALLPTGAKVSADVFGYTLLVDDDLGIGQNFINLSEYVDYLSPMVYPSHFPNGSVAVDGHPNDFPYETIEISMRAGRTKLDGSALQIRPWLQDFDYFDLMPYGDAEVRAQIKAADDVGTAGWMLWDPNNRYHPGGLEPDDGPNAPPPTPIAVLPWSRSVSLGRGSRLPRPAR